MYSGYAAIAGDRQEDIVYIYRWLSPRSLRDITIHTSAEFFVLCRAMAHSHSSCLRHQFKPRILSTALAILYFAVALCLVARFCLFISLVSSILFYVMYYSSPVVSYVLCRVCDLALRVFCF